MQGARSTRTLAPSLAGNVGEQLLGARHGAGQAVAHPHRDGGRRRAVLHHVEMGVEGRDLVDLGLGELHLVGERGEVRRRNVAVAVLDQVQEFDQQVAPARAARRAARGLRPAARGSICRPFGVLPRPRAAELFVGASSCMPPYTVSDAGRHPPLEDAMQPGSPSPACVARHSIRTARRSCRPVRRRSNSAAGTLGRPGIVMMSPQTATTNSAPADSRTSRTGMMWSSGAPLRSGLVEKLYWVLAMQTGSLP